MQNSWNEHAKAFEASGNTRCEKSKQFSSEIKAHEDEAQVLAATSVSLVNSALLEHKDAEKKIYSVHADL